MSPIACGGGARTLKKLHLPWHPAAKSLGGESAVAEVPLAFIEAGSAFGDTNELPDLLGERTGPVHALAEGGVIESTSADLADPIEDEILFPGSELIEPSGENVFHRMGQTKERA